MGFAIAQPILRASQAVRRRRTEEFFPGTRRGKLEHDPGNRETGFPPSRTRFGGQGRKSMPSGSTRGIACSNKKLDRDDDSKEVHPRSWGVYSLTTRWELAPVNAATAFGCSLSPLHQPFHQAVLNGKTEHVYSSSKAFP